MFPSYRRKLVSLIHETVDEPEISKLENLLWINTTHTPITRYRQLIDEMERKMNSSNPTRSKSEKKGRDGKVNRGPDEGPVALRKLLGRFRSFLSAEEKYWTDIIVRTVKLYVLDEAKSTLTTLSLNATDPDDLIIQPEQDSDTKTHRQSVSSNESPLSPLVTPTTQAQKLSFVQKCLIQLGDLARYRELYNDKDGRPPAGKPQDVSRPRGSRIPAAGSTSNSPPSGRPRNFSRAFDLYRQAKFLIPSEGNPSNQLAILCMYSGDVFGAIFHYYRALCVEHSFPTSRDNLVNALKKVQSSSDPDNGKDSAGGDEVLEVRAFKRKVLELHGFWHGDPQCVVES